MEERSSLSDLIEELCAEEICAIQQEIKIQMRYYFGEDWSENASRHVVSGPIGAETIDLTAKSNRNRV